MKKIRVIKKSGEVICNNAVVADSFLERGKGLMFSHEIPEGGDGMLIEPCNSIHTCFMKYDLHIVFLNSKNKVVKIIKDMKPWKFTFFYFSARKVLELKTSSRLNLSEGDELEVICIS
jgi:uncharacterized membrane protein (UPF0127 family)